MEIKSRFSEKAKHDYKLVQSAKDGNQKAYTELLEIYKDALYFLLLKMVNNKNDAEDLTIKAFEKAFLNLNSYNPNFAFSTWLYKIATNIGIDFIRTKSNRNKHISIDLKDENSNNKQNFSNLIKEPSMNPEEKIIQNQKKKILKKFVKKLPKFYKEIIVMRYFDGFSYLEISKTMNIPVGTVKTRLFRARELLSGIFKESNINQNKI